MESGVIYVATGEAYRDLACQSARSLRMVEPNVAIDLFTDAPDQVEDRLFDAVHLIANPHPRSKLDCLGQSRFVRTLFLDCDTLVVNPLGDLFDVLDRFDFAVAHDVRRETDLIQEGLRHKTPRAVPQVNSGVMLYRTATMQAFFKHWAQRFQNEGQGRDQPILKDMLWEGDLRYYVLPPEYNLRRLTMLDAWEPGDARPVIVHSHRLMDHMRHGTARISTVEDLVEAERAALADEWELAGGRDAHPIKRFDPKASR